MKTELEEPFKSKWKRAYLRVGLTGKEISLKTGFNRNTVMKYW